MRRSSLIYDFPNRISRAQWWLGMAGIGAIMSGAMALGGAGNPALLISAAGASAVLFIPLTIGRLHDRGRSIRTALCFLSAFAFTAKAANKLLEGEARWYGVGVIVLSLAIFAIVELGFTRGTRGDNEYGRDPLDETGGIKRAA